MTGTTHALIGAAIGTVTPRPGWAFLAGVASHALLDRLPHKDYNHTRVWPLLADLGGVVALLLGSRRTRRPEVLASALGGILPDLEHIRGTGNSHPGEKWFPSHWFEHRAGSGWTGIAIELVVAGGAGLMLWSQFRRR